MNNLSRSLQTSVSTVVTIAMIFALIAGFVVPQMAKAGTFSALSLSLGSSKQANATNVTMKFTTTTQLDGDTTDADDDGVIFLRLPTAGTDPFTIGSVVAGDIILSGFPANVTVNSVTLSSRGGSAGNDTIAIGLDQTNVTTAVNITASTALTIDIVNNRITTPAKVAAAGTADIWEVSFASRNNSGASDLDNGATQVAVIDATATSATVNTTLTMTVAAIASGTSVFGVTTDAASTAVTIPFGTLAPNAAKEVGQRLTITTNAPTGYSVYVVQDGNLIAGTNDIDQFRDGTRVDDSADVAWTQPAVVASSEATYGHMGYGSTDTDVFTSNQWAGVPTRAASSSAPVTTGIACNNTAATTGDICDVVYKVEISALQEAGSYVNEITYVVAPLY